MQFTQTLWQQNEGLYQTTLHHPFNQELAQGTLPLEKFKHYIAQDALYLADFAKALALMAARSTDSQQIVDFLEFAQGAIIVERALHESYFTKFSISAQANTQKTPACFAYTHFLLSTCALAPLEVGMAALLPCFWIYREVGNFILAHHQNQHNPYQEWIDTYAGDAYSLVVDKALALANQMAEAATDTQHQAMHQAYRHGAHLEYWFWDSAYHLEHWRPA